MESYRTLGGGSIDGYFGKNPDWSKIKVKTGRTIWSSYDDNTLQAWLVEDINSGGVLLAGGNYANPIQIAGNGLPEIAGYFVDGFEFKNPNQVGIDASGNSWRYIGTSPLPYTVTAGTVPSAPDYEKVFESTASNVNTSSGGSVQDFIDLKSENIEGMIAKAYAVDDKVTSGLTTWLVTSQATPLQLNNGLYVKPVGQIYLGDFKGGVFTDSEAFLKCSEFGTEVIVNGEFDLSGIEVLTDGARFEALSGLVSILRVTSDTGTSLGRGLQFGKIKSGDSRDDNLPVYNGLIDYWDENEFSPADSTNPRISNSGINGCTIIIEGDASTGVSFYRTNDCFFDCHVKFENNPTCGNSVRGFMNKNMNWGNTTIDDNLNSTYSFFCYWSYGDTANNLEVGASSSISFELKHAVQASFRRVDTRQDSFSKRTVNIGYGSIGVEIGELVSNGGIVDIHSSKEFEISRNITISNYTINNFDGDGLSLYNLKSLNLGVGSISATRPFVFSSVDSYMFNSNSGITPVQNSAPFVYDGNYDTVDTGVTPKRYYESRPVPTLSNSDLGVMTLKPKGTATVITGSVPMGITSSFDGNGKYKKNVTPPSGRGFEEGKRFSHSYSNEFCNSIKNCKGSIAIEIPSGSISDALNVAQVVVSSDIDISLTGSEAAFGLLRGVFNSRLHLSNDTPVTNNDPILDLYTLVDSEVKGNVKVRNRAINFVTSGNFYNDGFEASKIKCNYRYQSAPISGQINISNLTNADNKPNFRIDFDGSTISRDDNGSLSLFTTMITDLGETQTGKDVSSSWIGDVSIGESIVRRIFTSGAGVPPPFTPRFVGEMVENTSTGVFWIANTRTGFVEM